MPTSNYAMQKQPAGVCAKSINSIMLKLRGSTFLLSYHYCKPSVLCLALPPRTTDQQPCCMTTAARISTTMQVRSRQVLPATTVCQPAIKRPTPPKHTHSEAQRGHQPVQKVPDPDGA